jgi:hypothetical protein
VDAELVRGGGDQDQALALRVGTASRRALLLSVEPMLMVATSAPLSAAYRMAWATRSPEARNVSEIRRTISLASGATPDTPIPLSCWATAIPAVPVPCPYPVSSVASLSFS